MRQKTLVGTGPGSTALAPFTSSEATASGGIGARIALGSHVFVAPEFRLGWEPETRIDGDNRDQARRAATRNQRLTVVWSASSGQTETA